MPLLQVVTRIRCAPKGAPCPTCGRPGRRKRLLHRRVRALAYRRVAWLEVTYAEYQARCRCRKYFRTWPLDVPPKADYDATVRQAVLDRLLRDRLNVEQTKAAMRRDFLVELSDGFVYDCLRWQLTRLNLAGHRQLVLRRFSGALCVDELHLGTYTLLLATDPLADLPVGFALVGANDQDHMGRFLRNLARWGLRPGVVISDGSSLYPELLAEIWPDARHQLCVFHLLRDMLAKVLDAVRRLRRAQARRGRAGRKRRRGRPTRRHQARRRQRGPTAKEKAAFAWKHRFLIVKRAAKLTPAERNDLKQLLAYLPELRTLWSFSQDLYRLLDDTRTLRVARWRYSWLRYDPKYQEVRELVEALELLAEPKLTKAMAFVQQPPGGRVRTNNHVEGMNRRLRFAEKVRYRWRKRKWVVRWVVLLLDVWWQQAAETAATSKGPKRAGERSPPQPTAQGQRRAA
jgi:Transposase